MSTEFSAYRDSVHRSLNQWPELSWLDRFLRTSTPANGDPTSPQVFDLIGNRFVASETDGTAASFSQALGVEAQDSRLRLVLVGHGESWDVDRDIVDVLCSRYSIDPRFVAQHFEHPGIRFEKNCPRDICLALDEVDKDFFINRYTWDLGGDVMFLSSAQLGSYFFLTYMSEGLSLAVHNEDLRVTRALKNYDSLRLDHDILFREIQQLVTLRRQIEAFLAGIQKDDINSHYNQGQEVCRILREMTEDLKDLLSLYQNKDGALDSETLAGLIQAQLDESREAKKTSVKLGYLSQLAYIFLPLQLTASAMGMNLKNFGTGNIELRTFLFMLATIAALSFAPLLFRLIFEAPEGSSSRIRQICTIMAYSRRAGFLFAWFCLFHHKRTNDELWDSGISWDLNFFKGQNKMRSVGGAGWARERATVSAALTSGVVNFFPRYWQRVLDELFDIIDTPQWGRKDMNYHTA
ncbi:MAG: hypothetical protein Q9201_001609 [Fulgogasparrea decipioides]